MYSYKYPAIFFLTLSLILSSCAPGYVVKILKKDLKLKGEIVVPKANPDLPSFHGIKYWLENKSVVNILLVPGMRHKEWHNFNNLIVNVCDSLELDFQNINQIKTYSGFEDNMLAPGEVTILEFSVKDHPEKRLNFYVINWTQITEAAKQKLRAYDLGLNYSQKDTVFRTFLANKVKDEYFMDIFADLALYRQPEYEFAIQHTVRKTLDLINEKGDSDKPLVFITGSMGGEVAIDALERKLLENKILFEVAKDIHERFSANNLEWDGDDIRAAIIAKRDSIASLFIAEGKSPNIYLEREFKKMIAGVDTVIEKRQNREEMAQCIQKVCVGYKEQKTLAEDFNLNLKQIFMLNNQLVFSNLLDYSTTDLKNNTTLDKMVLDKLEKFRKLDLENIKNKDERDVKIISFFDPNDVFGFQIPENPGRNEYFINIPISHATRWTIDGQKLKKNYLYRLPIGDLKDQLSYEIGDKKAFNVLTNLEEPSEDAKNNRYVFNYILNGHENTYGLDGNTTETISAGNDNSEGVSDTKHIKDGITWRRNHKLQLEKQIFNFRLLWLAFKTTKMVRPVELPHTSPPDERIAGLEACIRKNDTTCILTVHGMGSKDTDHMDDMSTDLAERLGFVPDHSVVMVDTDTTLEGLHFGVRKRAYKNGEGKHLFFMIVHWSPVTKPVKEQLFLLNRKAAASELIKSSDKSLIHRTIKEKIIVDGFVDVNLSLGKGGFLEQMSKAVGRGMELMIKDNKGPEKNIFLISGSLGSKVLYDHITHSLRDTSSTDSLSPSAVTQKVMSKTQRWYMLTNQLPMIGMKELDSANRSRRFDEQVWHSWEKLYEDGLLEKNKLEIVAFHDPNDILTFMLPPIDSDYADSVRFINLPMRTGDGREVDILELYKFVKRVDKQLFRLLDGEKKELKRKRINAVKNELSFLENIKYELKTSHKASDAQLQLVENRIAELEVEQKLWKKLKKTPLLVPALLSTYDINPLTKEANVVSQPYMIRFDIAHDKVKNNKRVLDVIAFGTPLYRSETSEQNGDMGER